MEWREAFGFAKREPKAKSTQEFRTISHASPAFGGCAGFKRLRHATDPDDDDDNGDDDSDDNERERRAIFFRNLDRVDAIVLVKKSSKSEPSSRFLSRSKFENFACHFLANSADRPRI